MTYQRCLDTEREAMRRLLPMLEMKAYRSRFVVTSKGRLSPFLQKTVGDVLLNTDSETIVSVEIKAEERHTGNLFLETWSNRHRETPGWMRTLDADFLFSYFLDQDSLYVLNFQKLRAWFSTAEPELHEVEQAKHQQLNDTWGRLAPLSRLKREVGFKKLSPYQDYGPDSRYGQMSLRIGGVRLGA